MNKSLTTCPHKWCSKNGFAFPHSNHKKLIYTLQGSKRSTVATSVFNWHTFPDAPKDWCNWPINIQSKRATPKALLSTYAFTCLNKLLWFEVTNSWDSIMIQPMIWQCRRCVNFYCLCFVLLWYSSWPDVTWDHYTLSQKLATKSTIAIDMSYLSLLRFTSIAHNSLFFWSNTCNGSGMWNSRLSDCKVERFVCKLSWIPAALNSLSLSVARIFNS
jgi:hypothetical protein